MESVKMFGVESVRALRRLRQSSVTAGVAIVSLGAAVAVVGLAGGVVWQLLFPREPYREESALAQVYATNPASCSSCIDGLSARELDGWREGGVKSFVQLASYRQVALAPADRRERPVSTAFVDEGFFALLGSTAAHGRVLSAEDHANGTLNAVASNGFWRSRLGGRPSALSSTLDIGDRRVRIVGIMPPLFSVPDGADLWLPASSDVGGLDRESKDRFAIGRLQSGVAAQAAQAELAVLVARENAASGATDGGRGIAVFGSSNWPGRASERSAVWIVGLTSLGLVLLCLLNVSHVFSVGALARLREYSIRLALGASDAQLRVGFLADAGVVAVLSAGVSVVLYSVGAAPATDYLQAVLYFESATASAARFALVAPLVSAMFALLLIGPSMRYVLAHAGHSLLRGSAASTPAQQRLRSVIVTLQLAGVFVVVAGAGLMIGSYQYTRDTRTGLDDEAVFVAPVRVKGGVSESDGRSLIVLARQTVAVALESEDVAVWSSRALDHFNANRAVLRTAAHGDVLSLPAAELWQRPYPGFSFAVSPQSFGVLGISVVAGRAFEDTDGVGAVPVAVVNEAAAHALWPSASAVGQQMKLGDDASREPWLTVVGVVENTALLMAAGLDMKLVMQGRDPPLVFQPFGQAGTLRATLAVRRPRATAADVVGLDRQVERALPQSVGLSSELVLMRRWMANASMVRRVERTTELMLGIAIAAIAVALIGVYGLADEMIRSRSTEIALRRALGAPSARIISWIGARLMRLLVLATVGGATLSVVIAMLGSRVLYGHRGESAAIRTGLAHGVSASDPRFYLAAGVFCALMLLLGAVRPLIAALRIQPADIMRGGE